jgi:hypothetical protein
MDPKIIAELKNPGSDYRGAPFWSWNGKLEPDELRWQIRAMRTMGLGGFFMHSRVGLATPYLSKEWMDCVAACVDEAQKQDMNAWLYDEDRWPSGAAGGLATKNPKFRARLLRLDIIERPADFKWKPDIIAAFTAKVSGENASDVKRLKKGARPVKLLKGHVILSYRVKVDEPTSWHNGFTYLDTMNHDAVKEFIRVTHEAYYKRFGKEFGKRIPGIFTDEPNAKTYGGRVNTPWTDKLPSVFRKRYGYDLLSRLPDIHFNVDGVEVNRTRVDMHDCTTFLFVDAFSRQISLWCGEHGFGHTGHALAEGTLQGQTNVVGAAMRFYEYMQAPGMDLLTQYQREYDTAKQVSSVAHQFGRRWRLTETYGCTGWDFNWEGHKALSDWQTALGINLRAQHLSWYTMLGEAKRDYPAGIFYQSPWWNLYSKVEDHYARINVLMSRGREVRDILVIHPIESMWAIYNHSHEEQQALQTNFWQLRDKLLAANLDFDYGDEDIMSRHGRVSKDKDGATIKVAKAAYKVVVVPELVTIRSATLRLLTKFARAGGIVIFTDDAPGYVDAQPSREAADFATGCYRTFGSVSKLIKGAEMSGRRVSITDATGAQIAPCLYGLREDKDAFYLYVCNTGHKQFGKREADDAVRDRTAVFPDVRIDVFADGKGQPIEVCPDTGRMTVAGKITAIGWTISTSLPKLGSRLFILPKKKVSSTFISTAPKKLRDVSKKTLRQTKWDIQLSEDNVLVLDTPRYRIGDGKWQKAQEILKVDDAIRASLGVQKRGGRMTQPWAREKIEKPKCMTVTLEYSFIAAALPTGAMYMAIEKPETFKAFINGQPVNMDAESGWWVDKSLRRIPLEPSQIKLGINTVTLICDYSELHPGLEMVYLLGQFGARVSGTAITMTARPDCLKLGDWVKQGLAFYSGNVCYTTKINTRVRKGRRLFVQVPRFEGTAVRILVDGNPAGIIAWEPHEIDITDFVTGDTATLGIEVIGHRRNSHGPLHTLPRDIAWFGPGEYRAKPYDKKVTYSRRACYWTDDYVTVPVGLMDEPRLVIRR